MKAPAKQAAAAIVALLLLASCGSPKPEKNKGAESSNNGGKAEAAISHEEQQSTEAPEVQLTDFQKAAMKGGTLIAEGKDGCPYIRRAAELLKNEPAATDATAAWSKEIVQTHGAKCGV